VKEGEETERFLARNAVEIPENALTLQNLLATFPQRKIFAASPLTEAP
jgi:hypothetical protein